MLKQVFVIFFIILISFTDVFAQNYSQIINQNNNEYFRKLENEQKSFLDSVYISEAEMKKTFIDGKDYVNYYYKAISSPILLENKLRTASLVYKGRTYNNIVLNYDTWLDQVIYSDISLIYNDKLCSVALNRNNTSSFNLYFAFDTLAFRFMSNGNMPGFNLEDGYYEIVYDNRCKCLIRHRSVYGYVDCKDIYIYKPVLYISTGDAFFKVNSRKQLLSIFGSFSDKIRRFAADNKIRLRKIDKDHVAYLLKYYESITSDAR